MNFTGKILLVDDEPHVRKFVSLLVRALGATRVTEAADGEEALVRYAAEQPDLVLLDVNMPRLDGLQTLQLLRARYPDSVVVMLTSLINRQTVEECVRLGAVGYLRKDNPRAEIAAHLERIIKECFGDDAPAASCVA